MTKREQADNLIIKMEKYFEENKVTGRMVINSYSVILDVEKYIQANLAMMKIQLPFMPAFDACYRRMQELKNYIEKNETTT